MSSLEGSKPDDPFCKCGHEKSLHTGGGSACSAAVVKGPLEGFCACDQFEPMQRIWYTHSSQAAM
jgi:hypothetical protein